MIRNIGDLAKYFKTSPEELERTVYMNTPCNAWIDLCPAHIRIGAVIPQNNTETGTVALAYPFPEKDLEKAIKKICVQADHLIYEAEAALLEKSRRAIKFGSGDFIR